MVEEGSIYLQYHADIIENNYTLEEYQSRGVGYSSIPCLD
jgi:hypothetical protein